MSGGGNCLPLDPPTKEQEEAAANTRKILFNPSMSIAELSFELNEKYNRDAEVLRASLFPKKSDSGMLAFHSLVEEDNHPQMREFRKKRAAEIRTTLEFAMLQSPMFVEKDENGIGSMNIDGIQCMSLDQCDEKFVNSYNTNLQNWSDDLDGFFPEPLQPFSF
jgi:hypothetical protein